MSDQLPDDAITDEQGAVADAAIALQNAMESITAGPRERQLAFAAYSDAWHALAAAITAQAATTERESIRQLAIERKAVYVVWHRDIKRYRQYPFADLLGGAADGAHPPGGAT